MSTSLSGNMLPTRRSDAAGHYWATRKWYYDWKYAPGGSKKREEVALPIPQPRRRQEAVEQPGGGSNPPDARVRQCVRELKISTNGTLKYSGSHAGLEVSMRPMARRLLAVICNGSGRAVPLAEMCRALWGRSTPASISAMHTTVFRANDALLRARCPLRIGIQDQWATIKHVKARPSTHLLVGSNPRARQDRQEQRRPSRQGAKTRRADRSFALLASS